MKNSIMVLLAFCLALPIQAQTEKRMGRSARKFERMIQEMYDSPWFISYDLIIGPAVYNPTGDPGILCVEFYQDTLSPYYEDEYKIYASLDPKDNFTALYSIGRIVDYRTGKKEVSFHMKRTFADGRVEFECLSLHFDQIDFYHRHEYDYADYSVDVEVEYDEEEEIYGG